MSKITDLHVSAISLVRRPATGKSVILRSEGLTASTFEIRKTDAKLQRVYGIVYAPGQVDSQGDYADADVIRRAATQFMRSYNQEAIDTEHSFDWEMALVAESWLIRKGDPLFPEEPDGAWAVGIQIYDPDLWKRLESGELTGLSLAGMAEYETPPIAQKSDEAPGWFVQFLTKAGLLPEPKPTEQEPSQAMKEEEIKALIASEIAKGVAAALAEVKKSEEDQKAKAEADQKFADLEKSVKEMGDTLKLLAQKNGSESGAPGGTVKKSFLD